MAPGSDERHPPQPPPHTGTVPKTKVRNCVPQEAVTPTRRDINSANLAPNSLDWVPVPSGSDYNPRPNYIQSSRKTTNSNSVEHDFSDIDNSLESALQRFVPVRPQPRCLPLSMQPSVENGDDSLQAYHQSTPNGVSPHTNHGAAAVMIVNPTTPNTLAANMTNPYNVSANANRNNLARSLHTARHAEGAGSSQSLSGQAPPHARAAKNNNIDTNVFDAQPGLNGHASASGLGEALVAACPDPATVERRLGQIREYIRVTSSLVDTMRNSEDEEAGERNGGGERTAKFCRLLDRLALAELSDLPTNTPHHVHTNYHECAARPMSVQSTGSGYSDSELWHSELKAKMEVSQQRLAALQDQQKRLLKYQAEAKQHLSDMQQLARERHAHDNRHRHATPPPDNTHAQMFQQNQVGGSNQSHRMYNSNQIGVATTLPHNNHASNINAGGGHGGGVGTEADSTAHNHHNDERFAMRNAHTVPHNGGERSDDEAETTGDATLSAHGRELQHKLQDLQRKKQHMENLVAEFQKLQAAERLLGGGVDTHNNNTYSSDESGAEDSNPQRGVKKNEDPFNLMEITAIKAALEKTKDLMRTVERYDAPDSGLNEDFQVPSHSNINDNKSEGGRSGGEWSTEGSVCRSIHNAIQPGKLTNHDNRAHGGSGNGGAGPHEASISSLQLLTQQLRQEAEQVAGERQRLRQAVSRNKDGGNGKLSKKKLLRSGSSGSGSERGASTSSPGPLERTQHALRAELADKQRQLAAILNKQKELTNASEAQNIKQEPCGYAINQSYNSEQEEGDSQAGDIFPGHTHSEPELHYQNTDGGVYADGGAVPPPPAHGNYFSDSDNASRCKSDTRSLSSRRGRPLLPERAAHQHVAGVPINSMPETAPPSQPLHSQTAESSRSTPSFPPSMPLPHQPPPPAWPNKSNQDCRSNQFTTNSHSQTSLEQLLGMQHVYPPSMPFNVMMPYGAFQGGAGACGCWGLWCWQQLAAQQREIHQLRDQLNNLEERWRSETTPHALNNQVPPGNRANNYWDNFRSYSRQNLLSAHSKTNADGHLGSAPPHPQPLAARSHNALHQPTRDNRHLAPDVLNHDPEPARHNLDTANHDPEPSRHNLDPTNLINHKKKSSSKLPAKNSAMRRNRSLDYVHNDNINIASSSRTPDPNLASTSRDKASKMRENVYAEVTALIGANESHPDFLLQLFRDLQSVSSDSMRRSALQSIRNLIEPIADRIDNSAESGPIMFRDIVDFMIAHGEETCTPDLLEAFKAVVINAHHDAAQSMPYSQKKLQEFLSKYEGCRLREVSARIIDDLTSPNREEERGPSSQEGASGGYSWEGAAAEGSAGRLASEGRVDLIDCVEMYNGDLAEADQTCSSEPEPAAVAHDPADLLPDVVETEEITPTEAEAGWLGLDRVPTRLHTDDSPANQKD